MKTLIIDRKGMRLEGEGNRLLLRRERNDAQSIPLRLVERVVVSARVQLDSRLLRRMALHGIGVVFIDPRRPDDYAWLAGPGHNDAGRRIEQLRASENERQSRRVGRVLIRAKLQAQCAYLEDMMNNPAHRRLARQALDRVARARDTLEAEAPSLDRLRGLEGAAAAAYFKAYRGLFSPQWGFTERNRRPPRDGVNAMLSLGYTLADGVASQQILAAGLDPMIGFYHRLGWSRRSFACDLLEPVRPLVDRWVAGLVRERQIRPDHFRTDGEGCFLGKTGRAIYYREWATQLNTTLLRPLKTQLQAISAIIHETADTRH